MKLRKDGRKALGYLLLPSFVRRIHTDVSGSTSHTHWSIFLLRNRMIRAAARNALVRALRLNECLEDVEALYAEPKPWCFIKLYGTEKEGKYWYSFANTPEGAKERTQFMRK